jgi:hypothetical protein
VIGTNRLHLAPPLVALTAALTFAGYLVPRAFDAGTLIAIQDDPAAIADRALDRTFTTAAAERGIKTALAAKDTDLAQSFVDLAAARHVAVDPALAAKVDAVTVEVTSTAHKVASFGRGLMTGAPDDMSALAGTALGDLFVFGDIRDAAREGAHFALGEPVDRLVLGLAAVGIAITAGTYVTLGVTAPIRAGLTLAKVARTSGRLGAKLSVAIGRLLREAVDWSRLRRAVAGGAMAKPALAAHAAREAVKVERAGGLMHFVRDIGRIERKAGTQAALDSFRVARNPIEMSRVAKLAEKNGNKTRAILKLLGRGAIALSVATFDLGLWIFGALLAVLGFVSSLKAATERATLRILNRRKQRRRRECPVAVPA